jgi:uncharacterized ubiquitin-like protein YukD
MTHNLIILDINAISAGTKFRKHYSEIIKNYPEADIYAQRCISSKKPEKVNYLDADVPGNVHFIKVSNDTTIILGVTRFTNHGVNTHIKECTTSINNYINNNYTSVKIRSYHPMRKIQGNFAAEYNTL